MRTIAALLLCAAGCVTVHSKTSENVDLARYRTFAWYASPTATERQRAFERSPAGDVVRARIAHDLAEKGIHETTATPDFLVAYHTQLEQKVDVDDWGYPSLFWGAPPGPVTYDEYTQGNLVVDFIDPKSGRVFWRGTASAVIDRPDRPNLYKLASAVDKVMKRYPVEAAPPQASASAPPRQKM